MKKVVFLGLNSVCQEIDKDILNDDNIDVWTLNDYYRCYPWLKPDRIFQIHMHIDNNVEEVQKTKPYRYVDWRKKYNESGVEIVTLNDLGFENQFILDPDKLAEDYGREFFRSSFSYMGTEAIRLGYDEVILMGFSLMMSYEHHDCFPNCIYICDKMKDEGIIVNSKILDNWNKRLEKGFKVDLGPIERGWIGMYGVEF